MKYRKWDYDTNRVTEYVREGECNGCGACCKALIQFTVAGRVKDKDGRNLGNTTNGVGVWSEVQNGKKRRFFRINLMDLKPEAVTCSALSPENKCTVHQTKLPICEVWPVLPEQVTPFSECSYKFIEIGSWPIEVEEST